MNKINLWNYYMTIEMPALNIILQMLLNGILINRDELIYYREELLVNQISFIFLKKKLIIIFLSLDFNE